MGQWASFPDREAGFSEESESDAYLPPTEEAPGSDAVAPKAATEDVSSLERPPSGVAVARGVGDVEDADVEQAERANKHRVENLLAYGDALLCDIFRAKWSAVHGEWRDGTASGQEFIAAYYPQARPQFATQRQKLEEGVVEEWDTTMLSHLLLNVPWLNDAEKAAICDIRASRNKLSHAPRYRLPDTNFAALWHELETALVALGGSRVQMERVRAADLSEDTTVGLERDGEAEEIAKDHREEGNRQFRLGEYKSAIASYGNGIALGGAIGHTLLAMLHCSKAAAHLKLEEAMEAKASAKEALRLQPLYFEAQKRLAESYIMLSCFQKAVVALERAMGLTEGCSEEWQDLNTRLAACRLDADKEARKEDLYPYYAGPQYGSQRAKSTSAAKLGMDQETYEKLSATPVDLPSIPGRAQCTKGHNARKRGDDKAAFREFLVAATEFQSPDGMYNVGVCFSEGIGTRRDLGRAFDFFVQATECPIPPCTGAMSLLGPRARTLGIGEAHNALGRWYNLGIYVQRSEKKALYHWQQSAAMGGPRGCNNLGIIYMDGTHGVRQDTAMARELYQKAVDLGAVTEAMINLGNLCYQEGDVDGAIRWAEAAVAHGDARATEKVRMYKKLRESLPSDMDQAGWKKGPDEFMEEMHSINKNSAAATYKRKFPAPSLRELEAIRPRTKYIEGLIEAKRILSSLSTQPSPQAFISAAATAVRLEDGGLVLAREEAMAILLISTHPDVEHDADWACVSVLCSPQAPSIAGRITQVGILAEQFPDDWWLARLLGQLHFFPGAAFDTQRGLRELTRSCKLQSEAASDTGTLYDLGVGHNLHADKCSSDATLHRRRARDFFRRFLRAAEGTGHRKVGIANFFLGQLELRLTEDSSMDPAALETARRFYDAGVAADAALPPFLREEQHTSRRLLKAILSDVDARGKRHSNDESADPCGGDVLVGGAGHRVKRAGLAVKELRRKHTEKWQLARHLARSGPLKNWSMEVEPQTSVGRVCAREQAADISLQELFVARQDQAHLDRVLTCLVVQPPSILTAAHIVVEDAAREPKKLAVYGWDMALLAKLTIGRIIRVYQPYARYARDGPLLRVRDPSLLEVGDLRTMCWHCLRAPSEPMRRCSACKVARYCGRGCQELDWKGGPHKFACKELRARAAYL